MSKRFLCLYTFRQSERKFSLSYGGNAPVLVRVVPIWHSTCISRVMASRRFTEQLYFSLAVALSRFAFRSHALYDLDSVNFALGMTRFDPRTHQPHPPGYFLYITLGRMVNSVVHDANLALVLLSIVASCGTVVLVYQLALDWYGVPEARFASLIFLFSPLGWFHGTVALTYGVEAFFSALVGYLCWQIEEGRFRHILEAAIVLGLSAGVRPSSLLLLAPILVYSARRTSGKLRAIGGVALVVTVLAWAAPMLLAAGGIRVYLDALLSLWRLVPGRDTIFNSSPGTSIARAVTVAFIVLLLFGSACLALPSASRTSDPSSGKKWRFTIVWISPALCFYVFIFLKFVNSGYLLLLIAPGCLWLGRGLAEWFLEGKGSRRTKMAVIAAGALVNASVYLVSPFYCSYRSVRGFEAELAEVVSATRRLGAPANTLIIGFDSHFLGYRHAGYYLPDYRTVEFPQVELTEGTRTFTMQNGDTTLGAGVSAVGVTRFLLFPLPAGDAASSDYIKSVEKLLPAKDLNVVHLGMHDYVSGPVSDLVLLFPASEAAGKGVYPPLHPDSPDVNRREHFAISAR